MQRPEAKNPPKRPSISAETGNLKMGVKKPRRSGLFAVDVEICGFGRLDGGVRSHTRTGLGSHPLLFPVICIFFREGIPAFCCSVAARSMFLRVNALCFSA